MKSESQWKPEPLPRMAGTNESDMVGGAYRLPKGVPVGARVKLIAFDCGYYTAEYEGQQFTIPMHCIDGY